MKTPDTLHNFQLSILNSPFTPLARRALEVELARVPSAVLRRLIAEVRAEQGEQGERRRGYDRAYTRHSRSGGYDRAYNRHHRGR